MEKEIKSEKCSGREQNKNEIKRNKTIQFKDRSFHTFLIPPLKVIDSFRANSALECFQQLDEILNYLNTGKVCLVQKCTTMFETIAELIC